MGKRFYPGTDVWHASDSAGYSYTAVFEGDGKTGYFYAYDRDSPDEPILDAVHIYDVSDLPDRDREYELEICWSSDGLRAGLLINEQLHAVLDFEARTAYCRTNFPPPRGPWREPRREPWSNALASLID